MNASAPLSAPGPGDVHIWWIDLERIEDGALSVLSPDERARAERFSHPRDRARWAGARAALRQILAGYSGVHPAALRLAQGVWGKPALAGGSPLRFSLTHAGERAALAVAWEREVGIDLEPVDPELDVPPLLAVACSPAEAERIGALPPAARPDAFLTCWTLKEAYLKGIGAGLARDPRTIEMQTELLPDDRAAVFDPLAEGEGLPQWDLRLLDAGLGWIAAVASPGPEPAITVHRWPPLPETARAGDGARGAGEAAPAPRC